MEKQKDSTGVFDLIEVAFDGAFKRNILIKKGELKSFAKKWKEKNNKEFVDCYKTYFSYPEEEMRTHFEREITDGNGRVIKKKNSVADYPGSCDADDLPVDIDYADDLEKALQHTKEVALFLESKYDVDLNTLRFFYSGFKGFHIEIPKKLIGFEPSESLNDIFKVMVLNNLLPEGVTVDSSVYDKTRLWRIPNTINGKSKLYKIPLSRDELFSLTVDEIRELAKGTRGGDFYDPDTDLNPALHELYLEAKRKVEREGFTDNGTRHKAYEKFFQQGTIHEGEGRNNALYSEGCRLTQKNLRWEEIRNALYGFNQNCCEPPLGQEEFEKVLQSVFRYFEGDNITETPGGDKPEVPYPKPMSDKAFYGLAGDTVRSIEPHSESDRTALLMNFLTGFGNVIGDGSFFKVEADIHPMRLNCVLVGGTSKARKGTSWGYIKNLFHTIDPDWTERIQTGLSSGEGLIWTVRDRIERTSPIREKGRITGYETVLVDEGVTDKRLLVIEGEFATTLRVMEREGNTLSPVIRCAWDTGNLQTLTKNSPAKSSGAHISIIGHITREELTRYLTATECGNGFGNRFLFLCVQRSKSLPFGGNIQEVNFEPLLKRLRDVVSFGRIPGQITWHKNTRPLWAEIYPALSEGKPGLIGALTARAEAYVTRLSCVYALLDGTKEIRKEHLEASIAIWDYCEDSVRHIFQNMTGDPLANEILSALMKNPDGMTRTEIYNYFQRNKSKDRIEQALEILSSTGRARKVTIETGGRDKEIWILNRD